MSYTMVPIGMVFQVTNGATPKSGQEDLWDGNIPWVTPADLGRNESTEITSGARSITRKGLDSCGTQIVASGSIILSIRAPIGHAAIAAEPMCFNQGCRGLTPTKKVLSKYGYWAILAARPKLQSAGQGTTFQELGRDKLRAIKIPLPDLLTQKRITDLLDHETGRIDALIAKKEQMASLLSEKRRLSIEEEFKNSGGTPYKLKHLATIRKGRATATEADDNKDHALVTMDYLRTGNPTHYIDQNTSDVVVAERDCLVVWDGSNAGEIILARTGILSSTIAKIVPSKRIDRDYLFFALKSAEKILRDSCNGMGIPHVDGSMLKNIIVPMIDLERQKEIAASLMEKTANIDRVIALTRTSIERLKEYRSALITAAVTGQIDVTTYKAWQITQDTGDADTTDQATTNTA